MVDLTLKRNEKLPNVRVFGGFFAFVFASVSFLLYFHFNSKFAYLTLIAATFFLIATVINARLLQPLNRFWFYLGLFLGKITNPIITGSIYFLFITPIALISKLMKRDVLMLNKQKTQSYWIQRNPNNFDISTFRRQY
jgi:hypothetical protein